MYFDKITAGGTVVPPVFMRAEEQSGERREWLALREYNPHPKGSVVWLGYLNFASATTPCLPAGRLPENNCFATVFSLSPPWQAGNAHVTCFAGIESLPNRHIHPDGH